MELIEPGDPSVIPEGVHEMDHVGYVVGDIPTCMPECHHRGLRFIADAPATNSIGPAGAVLRHRHQPRLADAPDAAARLTAWCCQVTPSP